MALGKCNALSGNIASGHSRLRHGSEHYTPALRLAWWNALASTGGHTHEVIRPNHIAAPERQLATERGRKVLDLHIDRRSAAGTC